MSHRMILKSRRCKKSAEQGLLLGNCQEQYFNPVPTLIRSSFRVQKSEAIHKFRLVNKYNTEWWDDYIAFLVFARRGQSLLAIEHGVHFLYLFRSLLKPEGEQVLCSKISLLKNY